MFKPTITAVMTLGMCLTLAGRASAASQTSTATQPAVASVPSRDSASSVMPQTSVTPPVISDKRGPGHSFQAGIGLSDNDIPIAELGYLLHLRRVKLGVVAQLGVLRYASIGGTIATEGLRIRTRIPVWLRLASIAEGRLRADLLLAPGVRSLSGQGRSAVAITADTGLQATIKLGKRWTVATAMILPVAVDVTPRLEVARFPGLTVGAGAWVQVAPRWSVGARAFVSAPEGYGGDSEKSAVEGSLGVRFRFGDRHQADNAAPLLNASI